MKNILVLIDLSRESEKIAHIALNLAKQLNANVLLCNTVTTRVIKMALSGTDEEWQVDENGFFNVEQMAYHLNQSQSDTRGIKPKVNFLNTVNFDKNEINEFVKKNNVWLIVTSVDELCDLEDGIIDPNLKKVINNSPCPVMIIPDGCDLITADKIAYLTDLRYCSLEAVKFLKAFNAYIFVTHISANGIPNLDDSYAQNLLSDAIAYKINYNKLFLRNIKGKNISISLNLIKKTTGVKIFAMVNQQHGLIEKFLFKPSGKIQDYHHNPMLIMPYLNWHVKP